MKHKRRQEVRITALRERYFPLSNIAGYNLVQDKTTFVMFRGVRGQSKLRRAKESALASCARSSLKFY